MPDKAGAFLRASKIIASHHGNIVRTSYNKAVDLHTLFIDIEAPEQEITGIENSLKEIGYIDERTHETRIIEIVIKIPDVPGGILPVLEIIAKHDINISYLNSSAAGTEYQNFKMGLLIEKPKVIRMLLEEICAIYPVDVVECDDSEENLDSTVFYLRLAAEMQKLLHLNDAKTMEFVSESNRVLQMLQDKGENPDDVFRHIRRFAYFIHDHKGSGFAADIEKIELTGKVSLYNIQPPCGSNTYVLSSENELAVIDTGYAIYADELSDVFTRLFPDRGTRLHRVFITHADVDHCGLLSKLADVKILLNRKSAESLRRQKSGLPDNRENSDLRFGYSKLSRIISGYVPPDDASFEIIGENVPDEHEHLLKIGAFTFADCVFDVYEGSGGHLSGEMVFASRHPGVVFTGDILVNISGFTPERAEFNSLAPYLMRSVNVDSKKAAAMRKETAALIEDIERENKGQCIVCGGHGPLSALKEGKLERLDQTRVITL